MRLSTLLVIVGLGGVLVAAPLRAHHSTIDIYDEEQTVEITGTVSQWRLVNPHPYLVVEVTTPDGTVEDWDVSFGGSAAGPLRRRGYTPESFKVGDVIVVSGAPARSADAHGLLVRGGITREDGTAIP